MLRTRSYILLASSHSYAKYLSLNYELTSKMRVISVTTPWTTVPRAHDGLPGHYASSESREAVAAACLRASPTSRRGGLHGTSCDGPQPSIPAQSQSSRT